MAKDERLHVRLTKEQMDLIRSAAEVEHRTVSDFAVTALSDRANDVLADQRVFELTGSRWDELVAVLDRPATVRPQLAESLRLHAKYIRQ
ncbi:MULTISPECIES: DUF1778 domain-containing protein [Mumia]|uniref:type II toxin-antitoxin system TacA family antitoxin n=1 Tax=Mumia TaxID=1546255 RepID=UPI001423AA5D|nr:DUF1778 domain-containing protein [Mumia sp. ZJ430]